jgi:hypothetical protein
MRLDNRTPAQAMAFRQHAPDGGLDCVVSAGVSFHHRQDSRMAFAAEQPAFAFEDVFDGDPATGLLLRQSGLVPGKPGTDVTFLGDSHAPGGQALPRWRAGIRIGDRLRKLLLVSGPRQWLPIAAPSRRNWMGMRREPAELAVTGWRLSDPAPARSVALQWRHAFGGPVMDGDGVHPDNPLGPGLLDARHGDPERPLPAHQLEDPDRPVVNWREHAAAPQCFAPIPPWWRPRQRHAGTYDEAWMVTRHPLLPEDFDPRFWQCAPPDMVITPHLVGDEGYELANLHPEIRVARGVLPGVAMAVHCADGDAGSTGWHRLALDGLHFDFRDGEARIALTWRTRFPLNRPQRAVLTLAARRMVAPPQAAAVAA